MSASQDFQLIDAAMFNAMPGSIAVVNREGTILSYNGEWGESGGGFFGFADEPLPKKNFFEYCESAVRTGNDAALKAIFRLREVLDGTKEKFEITGPCVKKSEGEPCWFRLTLNGFESGGERLAVVVFEDVTKNAQAIHKLRESDEIYRQYYNNSLFGILITSPEGEIYDANPAACKLLGYSRQELIDGGRSMIMDAEIPLNQTAHLERAKKSYYEGEKEYIRKDGRPLIAEVSSVLYKSGDGRIRCLNTFKDLSREKKVIHELEQEKLFNEATIKSLPGTFFIINQDRKMIRINDVMVSDLGYSREEIFSMDALDFYPEKEKGKIKKAIEEVFQSGSTQVVAEVLTKEGESRIFHLIARKFESNDEVYIVGTGNDITQLAEVEKEKEKNYGILSQLFEGSPLPMAMFSADNKIIKINGSFTETFGYDKLEAAGENVHELLVGDEDRSLAEEISKEVFAGQSYSRELFRYTRQGERLTVLMNAVPIMYDDEVIAAYVIYVDLTNQKALEKQLQKTIGDKEILLQEVHHRVKNNLAIMAGLIDLEIMEGPDARVEQKLNEIRSRIFSIAKIHEGIYSYEDMVNVRFDHYLESVIEALPQKGLANGKEFSLNLETVPVVLNLNQAVPCGLAVNELLNIVFSDENSSGELCIDLTISEKDEVCLTFNGSAIDTTQILTGKENEEDSFQHLLINIFLSQLKGALIKPEDTSGILMMKFDKLNLKGSSSSLKYIN
jgi:PAS domain S-box-containing protein